MIVCLFSGKILSHSHSVRQQGSKVAIAIVLSRSIVLHCFHDKLFGIALDSEGWNHCASTSSGHCLWIEWLPIASFPPFHPGIFGHAGPRVQFLIHHFMLCLSKQRIFCRLGFILVHFINTCHVCFHFIPKIFFVTQKADSVHSHRKLTA